MERLDIAISDTIHNSTLSAKEIAERLGKSHQVLLNKANPNNDTHHLTIREAVAIMRVTGNKAILEAVSSIFTDTNQPRNQESILDSLINAMKESTDVSVAVHEAMKDGVFTSSEKKKILREIHEAELALTALKQSVQDSPTGQEFRVV